MYEAGRPPVERRRFQQQLELEQLPLARLACSQVAGSDMSRPNTYPEWHSKPRRPWNAWAVRRSGQQILPTRQKPAEDARRCDHIIFVGPVFDWMQWMALEGLVFW